MPDNLPADDPKTLWQNQPTEPLTMTLEQIRQKARELHAKTRRELFANTMAALIAVAFSVYGILHASDLLLLVFALAIAWAVAGQYFIHRGMWSAMPPGNAALCTGLQFYRGEIERRRYLFRRVLQWSFGPMVLSIFAWIVMIIGFAKNLGQSAAAVIPFTTAFAVWIVGFFVQRSRGQRALQGEMDRIKDIDREPRP
jgi:hypothetical protein